MEHRTDQRLPDHERVVQGSRDLSASRIGVSCNAELSQRSSDVEVGPLADHAVLLELKDDDQRKVDFAPGSREPAPVPVLSPRKASLDDDCIVCVMHDLGLEPEIGKSLLILIQERVDAGLAVPDLSCGHDLVARVTEGGDAAIEVVGVFSLHVLTDRRFTQLSQTRRQLTTKNIGRMLDRDR